MRIEHWWFKLPLRLKSIFRRRRVETISTRSSSFTWSTRSRKASPRGSRRRRRATGRCVRWAGSIRRRKRSGTRARIHWLTDFVDDVRYAVRSLRRTPGLAAFVVVTIALGIGMTATPFSMLDALVFRPYPVPRPRRRGHARGHVARQRLRPVLLSRVPRHPRPDEELRRCDRQRAAADRRLQRAAATPRPSRKAACSSPATTSACSTSSRRSGAGSGTTKTRCPAATPWWSFRPTSGSASSRPIPPSSAGPSA